MKSTFRFLAIIVFVAVIGFSMVACSLFKGEEEEQETQTTYTQTPGGQIPGGEQPGGEQPGGEQPGTDPTHTHQYGEWLVTTHATCVETGVETRTCALDSSHTETRDIAIDPDAHVLGPNSTITKLPTCTEEGIGSGICTLNSAHVLNNSPISALGHDYGNWTQTTVATVTTDGVETRTCTHDSSHKETRTAYATGTQGLAYEAIGNTAYRVRKGTITTGAVHIPAYHRPDANSPYLPVTQIGTSSDGVNNAAFSNTTITSVTFAPDSQLKTIGDYTFYNCTSLTSITIPASLTFIDYFAFYQCASLTSITLDANNPNYSSEGGILYNKAKTQIACVPGGISGAVTIPEGVTRIELHFSYCTSLTSVTIPASVTFIRNDTAFSNCTSLTSITVASDNPDFSSENGILYNKAKTTLFRVPEGISGSVTIPTSVTTIGVYAFRGCTGLTSITIPTSVTSIDSLAFYNCTGLTSVTFAGTIASGSFNTSSPFPGDLRTKFYATDSANGTPGTYTATGTGDNKVWTRQP